MAQTWQFLYRRLLAGLSVYRAFWGAMFGLHVCVMPAALASLDAAAPGDWADGLVRLLALLLATAFFALKLADVPWLRLPPGRRPFVAAISIAALLHGGAVERATSADVLSPETQASLVLFVGALLEGDRLLAVLRKLAARLHLGRLRSTPATASFRGWLDQAGLLQAHNIPVATVGPRAPPTA